jgi:translation initiation factor 2 gamma subunit (eIF-2gamma)
MLAATLGHERVHAAMLTGAAVILTAVPLISSEQR